MILNKISNDAFFVTARSIIRVRGGGLFKHLSTPPLAGRHGTLKCPVLSCYTYAHSSHNTRQPPPNIAPQITQLCRYDVISDVRLYAAFGRDSSGRRSRACYRGDPGHASRPGNAHRSAISTSAGSPVYCSYRATRHGEASGYWNWYHALSAQIKRRVSSTTR